MPDLGSIPEWVPMESLPPNLLGTSHKEGYLERKATRAAELEAEMEEEDDDDDEDEDEEGEDEEEDEDEGEEDEEEEDPLALPPDFYRPPLKDDRFFRHNETLRQRFNEVEIEGFMKILNMKPYRQWQDDTKYHYKAGVKAYEDESQSLDPYFHLLAEVERKSLQRHEALGFRKGSEVKLIPDSKKAPVFSRQ